MNHIFKALSDPTRRRILQLLRERPMTAGQIAEHFDIAKPTLSAHFAVLREADLVSSQKAATTVTYSLKVSVLEDALLSFAETVAWRRRWLERAAQIVTQEGRMIDRKTALLCAVMIAPMFVAGVILVWDGRTIRAVHGGAPLPVLLPFFLPACGALVTASLYWTGRSAVADDAKKAPWYLWGRLVSSSYCAGLLLLQAVVIAAAFDLHVPPPIARTLSVVMAMMSLLAINQMPKLPWFERRWRPGGQLGPVYGPKYIRIASRMTVAFMIAAFAYVFVVAPGTGFRAVPYILVGAALLVVWSVAWRRHLGRKWSLERGGVRL